MGAAVVTDLVLFPGTSAAEKIPFLKSEHQGEVIAAYSDLLVGKPLSFEYPKGSGITNMLVRLGERAGMGIGPQEDLVAFHTICTHMGGDLSGHFLAAAGAIGPCPFHLSVFDLKRFGMVVTGHATSPLPQVELQLQENRVIARGFRELLYGREINPA